MRFKKYFRWFLSAGGMVQITAPTSTTEWGYDQTENVTWDNVDSITFTHYKLDYSDDAGATWNVVVGWTVGNPQTYSWALPDITTSLAKVRLTLKDASDTEYEAISNGVFFIGDVTAPSGAITVPA